jgi:hypothetical protein
MALLSSIINPNTGLLLENSIGTTVQAYDQNLTSFTGTFTLPTVDGTDGQALITRGNGEIQFGAAVSEGGGTSAGKAYAFSILFG